MNDAEIENSDGRGDDAGPETDFIASDDLQDASVTIGLGKTGEDGSGYHTRNDPDAPFQRRVAVDRPGVIEVRCESCEIVHGALAPDADEWATLLVYQINLDATKRSRRIKSATIEFQFGSDGQPPRIHALAPDGRYTVLPSTQNETTTRSGGANASGGAVGATAGVSAKWEKVVTRTTNDEARVTGSSLCDIYGRAVGARWILHENKTIESGVPSLLRCAMLVARTDESLFECKITIKLEADWRSELGRLFGATPTDDPVFFDPSRPATNRLSRAGYDTNNLAAVDLNEFINIRFQTEFKSAA